MEVGKVDIGRGFGRVRVEVEIASFEAVLGGGMLVILLIPKAPTDANRSREAAGRKRGFLMSDPPARISLDGEGRMVVGMAEDFGMGNREVGRGRVLGLPGWNLLSSIVYGYVRSPFPLVTHGKAKRCVKRVTTRLSC